MNVTLNCNEGGATITKAKLFSPRGAEFAVSPAREVVDLGIGPDKLDRLIDALRDCGAFEAETACFVETKPLPTAYTYVA